MMLETRIPVERTFAAVAFYAVFDFARWRVVASRTFIRAAVTPRLAKSYIARNTVTPSVTPRLLLDLK